LLPGCGWVEDEWPIERIRTVHYYSNFECYTPVARKDDAS
jgi:hypothetical protein